MDEWLSSTFKEFYVNLNAFCKFIKKWWNDSNERFVQIYNSTIRVLDNGSGWQNCKKCQDFLIYDHFSIYTPLIGNASRDTNDVKNDDDEVVVELLSRNKKMKK